MKEYKVWKIPVNTDIDIRVEQLLVTFANDGWEYRDLVMLENIDRFILILEREREVK